MAYKGSNMSKLTQEQVDKYIKEIWPAQAFHGPEKMERDWIQIAREVHKAQEYRKRYEDLEKKLMEELLVKSGHKECYAGGFKLEQIVRKGSIDYKAVPILEGFDLEPFRKESSSYWKLSTALTQAIDITGVL